MNFLTPAAFVLAALLPIIVAMYLLKLRRPEQEVSSIYLWRRMVRDVEANAPWQKLRRNLLMFLQLLFLAALIIALAQPFLWTEGASGQAVIVILDTSASMAAGDAVPSRLEAAKDQARQVVDGLPDDARVTVITAGKRAQVHLASSQDRRQIYLALDQVQVETGSSDMQAALGLASAIAARQPDTEIVILSDGRVELPERMALKGRLSYYPIGVSGENQAISMLSLDPAAGGYSAFIQVANYGQQPAQRRLKLSVDGQLFNAYDLEIEPGGQQAVIAEGLPLETQAVQAELDGADTLALDDRAWAVRRTGGKVPVMLVSEGNLFLETALSLLPGIEVSRISPDEYENRLQVDPGIEATAEVGASPSPTDTLQTELTIFDAYAPITATLPAGNLLFIAPQRSTPYFDVTGQVENPQPRIIDASDPLVSHINLAEITVMDGVRLALPPWAHLVAAGDLPAADSGSISSTPLLFAGQVEGRRVVVLSFDIRRSDLPLQVAFPLLVANLTNWLAPGQSDELPDQIIPGEVISLALPPEAEQVRITTPDGKRIPAAIESGRAIFAETQQLGVYQIEWDGAEPLQFAANLFSPQESNLDPAPSLGITSGQNSESEERPQQARRELWRPLGFAALAFLSVEWLVYQRAVISRWVRTIKMKFLRTS